MAAPDSPDRRTDERTDHTHAEHHGRRRSDDAPEVRAQEGTGGEADRRGSSASEGHWRRRAEDVAPTERQQGSRAGRALRRMRQPLIGLGLAGMAFPLVRATSGAETMVPQRDDSQLTDAAPGDEQHASAALDTEEDLAARIAETREEQERTEHVEAAVDRYNIARDLAEDIYDAAREANIEPKLAYGLIKTESTFNERAVSPVGARGLTQVMPRTAAWLVPGTKTQDLFDRQTNLKLGFTYLDQMIAKYKGNVRLALLAYNRGPGTVDKVLKKGGNPDNGYADKVLRG